ncbi:Thiol-disulfide isomerase or thioredoxin [Lentibacillus halodurans]|uniref:Thiol-disulfide isomerase or thioredoxin n=1 Tax=Lentibacillus halodurans TaxID=237679 RepID=A0A1I1ADN7_9BACI|nr:redoxin family protein [Lentibacillus halodurans]SFB35476.1 Thiol-disulfide isomerase or thioredoxin [Lentibacillus halodurans]
MKLRDQMPELSGATKWLNSKPLSKKELTGNKPVLIHFWSVSCDTCEKAMPKVNEFRDAYKGELHVIAVHMPRSEEDEDLNAVRRAAKKHNMTQPVFVDHEHSLTNAFKNRYVPAYYLFDANGRLRHRQSGSGGMHILQKRVDRVLNETGR